jgi:hypothetical protein
VLVAGCGESELSHEEYLQRVHSARQEASERSAEIAAPDTASAASLEDAKLTWRGGVEELEAIGAQLVEELEGLESPEELRRLHGLYLDATAESLSALKAYKERVLSATSLGEFVQLLQTTEPLEDAATNITSICLDLQDAAGEYKIDIDLECRR